MSDVDIMEELQKTGSQKRYRPEGAPMNGTQQQVVVRARASRTAEQPLIPRSGRQQDTTSRQRKTAEYPEPKTDAPRRVTQAYQVPDTEADIEVASTVRPRSAHAAPPTRQLPPLRQKTHSRQLHWLVVAGIAMISFLVVILLAVQVLVAWTNGVHDPGYYTQTAHLDMVVAATDAQGHKSQVRAFLDVQNHLDLLILPMSGDASKAHVFVGPNPVTVTDLRHATITVTAHGTVVSVLVQGLLEANLLSTTRQSSLWIIDLKKIGGH